ncbi:MAG: hypothetical protein A2798_02990 [Candidatus Levybacteria bacterium RIFCSPHIGHO2_01_FULL_37_17]|nr:MAG: hypothetical protein A2798_02990 [Candidatus Levybacteria bacterium RIFCSPHIGHO2_01_FULL_37_17]OGH36821.1 MAG: hypothetical protein A2959_00980 [Candidatus Levybacteria bacterium RIFCSPLOWO2_01_FULL_38_23]
MAIRRENPQVIDRIEMAKPANKGKWKRRALSVKNAVVDAKNFVTETKLGKGIAAVTLAAAISQTPVGKDVTNRVVEGAQAATNTVTQAFDEWMFGPHPEHNPWTEATIKRIRGQEELLPGEYFVDKAIITTNNPVQERVAVYPFASDHSGGRPVFPIGYLFLDTQIHHLLMTPGHKPGTMDKEETWGAFDCGSVPLVDLNGNSVTDAADKFPACAVPISNLHIEKKNK